VRFKKTLPKNTLPIKGKSGKHSTRSLSLVTKPGEIQKNPAKKYITDQGKVRKTQHQKPEFGNKTG
jgi:hypothetical protein